MDRLSEQFDLTRSSCQVATFLEPSGIERPKAVPGRRPVVRQFESKRLRSITAILAKVTARTSASCVTLEVGPASVYATTSPHTTAQADMCDGGRAGGRSFEVGTAVACWEKPEESIDPLGVYPVGCSRVP